jgi:hypothetical protein
MEITTSSTRGLIRLATSMIFVSVSGDRSWLDWRMVMATSFSVKRWQIFRMSMQCGTIPLEMKGKQ